MAKKLKSKTVGIAQVSEALGLSHMQVGNLCNDGTLAKVSRGQYDLVDCLKRAVRYYRERVNANSDSIAADRAREQHHRANMAERDDLVAAEKYVPVEAFQVATDVFITEFKEGIEADKLFTDEHKEAISRIAKDCKLEALRNSETRKFVLLEVCTNFLDAGIDALRKGIAASPMFTMEQRQELFKIAQGIKLDDQLKE